MLSSSIAVSVLSRTGKHVLGRRTAMISSNAKRNFAASFEPPKLFDYDTIVNNLKVADAIESVEEAFGALAKGQVDVPMPMHIGVPETAQAGPGDCHIKGGYIFGSKTFTVKLAMVSFYKNSTRNLPPGCGVFVIVDAATGAHFTQ